MQIELSKKNIPKYIIKSKSKLYDNFDFTYLDNKIIIPKNKYEQYIKISNIKDLYKYLEICRYWMIDDCPFEIYDYVYKNKNDIKIDKLKEKFHDLSIINDLEILIKSKYPMYASAIKGNLNLLKYLHEIKLPWNETISYYAAENGHLNCLKYLHKNGCPWDVNSTEAAAVCGHLNCLKYLHENRCPWDEYITSGAARYGHLDCLKYAHKNGCQWDEQTLYLANHFKKSDCLKYAIKNKCPGYEKYLKNI